MICTNCKKQLADGSKYCYVCGTVFEDIQEQQPQEQPQQQQQTQPQFQPQNQNANAYQNHQQQHKVKSSVKGLKIGVISFAGFLILSILVFGIISLFEPDKTVKLLDNDKKNTDLQELAASTQTDTSNSDNSINQYAGVWQGIGTKVNENDIEYSTDFKTDITNSMFFVIDEDKTVYVVNKRQDAPSAIDESKGRFENGYFVIDAEKSGTVIRMHIMDNKLVANHMSGEMQLEDCIIFEKSNIDRATILEKQDTVETSLQSQDVVDPNEAIIGKWQTSEHDGVINAFEFYDDGTFLSLTKMVNEEEPLEQTGYYGFIDNQIYLGDESNAFDYKLFPEERFVYWTGGHELEFFKTGEFNLGIEQANQSSVDSALSNGNNKSIYIDENKVKDIMSFVDESIWSPTGRVFDIEGGYFTGAEGYPIIADVEQGAFQVIFEGGNSIDIYAPNESGKWETMYESDYVPDSQGYYLYGFYYNEEINGEEKLVSDVFFAEGDYLYNYTVVDDVPASNIIEFKLDHR